MVACKPLILLYSSKPIITKIKKALQVSMSGTLQASFGGRPNLEIIVSSESLERLTAQRIEMAIYGKQKSVKMD